MRVGLSATLSVAILLFWSFTCAKAVAGVVGIDRSDQWIPLVEELSLGSLVNSEAGCRGTQVYVEHGAGASEFVLVGRTHTESIQLLVYYVRHLGTALSVTGTYRAIVFNEELCKSLGDFPLRYETVGMSTEDWFEHQDAYSGTVMGLDSPPWTIQQPQWEFSEKTIIVDEGNGNVHSIDLY